MKKKITKIVSIFILCIFTFGATGCTTYTNFKHAFFEKDTGSTEKNIKIGVFEPMSGNQKTEGKEEVMGIQLAHELYPTVCGKTVELVFGDNKSDIYEAETVIQEMIGANDLSVILGSYGETLTLIASDYAKTENIPGITISSTNPLITANNEYYFSATYSETRQGDALADFACSRSGCERVATVKLADDDTATATIKRFTNQVKKITGKTSSIVANYQLSGESNDYSETIEHIKKSGAQAVFLAVSSSVAESFLKQAMELEMTNICFLGTREWNNKSFTKFLKRAPGLSVAYPSEQKTQATETELYKEFLNAYQEKYGKAVEPSHRTAAAFDAYILAIRSIENALADVKEQSMEDILETEATDAQRRAMVEAWETAYKTGIPTGTQIKTALSKINNFEGASGTISYNGKNEATKSIAIQFFYNGQMVENYVVQ